MIASDAALGNFEPDQFTLHALGFLLGQRFAAGEIAFVEFTDPTEVRFVQRGGFVDVVSVERHTRFEAQRVARRETAGQHAVGSAVVSGVEKFGPELFCVFRCCVNFETVFASVASARDDAVDAVNQAGCEVVILDLGKRHVGQFLQNRDRVRALQCELAVISADVLEFDGFARVMRTDPLPIFIGRAGVYDQPQMVKASTVDEQVIDDRALFGGQRGVLSLAVDEFGDVVRGQAIHKRDGVVTADVDLAHVRDVEETGVRSGTEVFFDSAGGILNGHIPAAEIDHAAAHLAVSVIKWSLF